MFSIFHSTFHALFVPIGYPTSVSEDYFDYQIYDTLQSSCTYLKGILTTQAVLTGLGIGNADSSLHSAMLCWILRDAISLSSGLIFGSPFFTKVFESDLQLWRMASECGYTIAGLLELLIASQPQNFAFYASAAAVIRTASGAAGGCTRTTLMTHFAVKNNFTDCAVKEGNQDRAMKLIGMTLALMYMGVVDSENTAVNGMTYFALTIIHLLMNWLAVCSLKLQPAVGDKEKRK